MIRLRPTGPLAESQLGRPTAAQREWQQRLAAASDTSDRLDALEKLARIRGAIAEFTRGYPAVDASCLGSGQPADRAGIRFSTFRCSVTFESEATGSDT